MQQREPTATYARASGVDHSGPDEARARAARGPPSPAATHSLEAGASRQTSLRAPESVTRRVRCTYTAAHATRHTRQRVREWPAWRLVHSRAAREQAAPDLDPDR